MNVEWVWWGFRLTVGSGVSLGPPSSVQDAIKDYRSMFTWIAKTDPRD
jgi:hypothetical protein